MVFSNLFRGRRCRYRMVHVVGFTTTYALVSIIAKVVSSKPRSFQLKKIVQYF